MKILAILLGAVSLQAAGLRAGAAKNAITPDLKTHGPVYMAGFGNNRVATGVHDDLFARCFAMDAGGARALIICGVDSIGIFLDDVDRIRALVARSVDRADLVIASSHVHQGPDAMGLYHLLWKQAQSKSYSATNSRP